MDQNVINSKRSDNIMTRYDR